ncbi:MAG: lytic murein transglycosylase [Thermoleophilia bacterium]|nr:lytic murein transglycosylase [Thermoleophilia bacterium]
MRLPRASALALAAVALAALAAAEGALALPTHRAPNGAGAIVVPASISVPPAYPDRRSYDELLALWRSAGSAYGVPWEVLAAINKIESDFGRNMGPSSAGAVGWMQFLPSTWMRWGVDANGDGIADPWNAEDAIYAAARYLAAAGAGDDLRRAIYAYNHAEWYVESVLELARVFAGGGGFESLPPSFGTAPVSPPADATEPVFSVDAIDRRLEAARRLVAARQRELLRVESRLERLDVRVLEAEQRAGDPRLSDSEFQEMERRVTRLVRAREVAVDGIARADRRLSDSIDALERLRDEAAAPPASITFFAPATSGDDAVAFAGDHVFPVGGGPAAVSVPAGHHDYPAADIAAPEGSPVYALADGVIEAILPSPSGRCGIGATLRVRDGTTYLYCHLSYLERSLAPGTPVSAGASIGLVGSTGNATGPHLHLQRTPPDAFPQQEPWFQAFAGVAFRWQGAAPAAAAVRPALAPVAPRKPVFRVVEATPALGFGS